MDFKQVFKKVEKIKIFTPPPKVEIFQLFWSFFWRLPLLYYLFSMHLIVCWSQFLFKSSISSSFYFVDAENLTKFVTKFSCFVFWKLTAPFNATNTPDLKTNEPPVTKNVTFITLPLIIIFYDTNRETNVKICVRVFEGLREKRPSQDDW